MGLTRRLYDWLGNRLSEDVEPARSATDKAATECVWMEVARRVMAGYVTSALQLCEIRFEPPRNPTDRDLRDSAVASYVWNVSPNPDQSAAELRAEMCERLLVTDGRALVVPVRRRGQVWLYCADGGTEPEVRPGQPALYRQVSVQGSTEVLRGPLTSEQVYALDLSGIGGGWHSLMGQLDRHYDDLAQSVINATKDRNSRKWVYHMDQPMAGTKEQVDLINGQIGDSVMPFVRGTDGVLPLYRGQSIERASADVAKTAGTASADVTAIRKDMFATVAACFHMPASLLEGNVNNFSQTLSSFLTFAVDPVAEMLSQEITRSTYTREQCVAGARATVDTTTIKHVDLFDIADSAAKLVGATVDSPNEIRRLTRQRPIPQPWADEYQRTKNNETAGGGETNAND